MIGMEIIIDTRLEEALEACSLFDASDADDLSFGHPGEDEFTLDEDDGSDSDSDSDSDDSSASSEETSLASQVDNSKPGAADDDLMARLAGAYLTDDDSSSDDDSDSDSDSDSDDDSLAISLGVNSESRSMNTDVAVMLGMSRDDRSQDLTTSVHKDGSGTGRTRRHRGSRRTTTNNNSESNKKESPSLGQTMNLKDLAMTATVMKNPNAVLQTTPMA